MSWGPSGLIPVAAAPLLPEAEGASTVCHKDSMSKLPPSKKLSFKISKTYISTNNFVL